MNIKAIRQHPAAQESFGKGEFHQAILDVGYSKWREQTNWDYRTMLEYTEKTYGVAAKLFILLGEYNQQVTNGGRAQYRANGFADGPGGFGDDHGTENPLHQEMISLFKEFKLQSLPSGAKLLAILEELKIELNEEREIQETIESSSELRTLARRYYQFSGQWMEELGNHVEPWFESGEDPFAGSGANRLQPATNSDQDLCSTVVFDPFNL
jgi:hypothetical protein